MFAIFNNKGLKDSNAAWKMSKYGVVSGWYFPVFSPKTGKYGPEITAYMDTFHAAKVRPNHLYLKE